MSIKKKMALIATFLIVVLIISIIGMVVVLVSANQKADAIVNIYYKAEEVSVKLKANAYVGSTSYAFTLNGGGKDSATELVLNPTNPEGYLSQPEDVPVIELNKANKQVVFEYIFTNMADLIDVNISLTAIPGMTMSGEVVEGEVNDNLIFKYAYSNAPVTDINTVELYDEFSDQLVAGYSGESTTKYVYIVATIDNVLYNADLQGTFAWALSKADSNNIKSYIMDMTDVDYVERIGSSLETTDVAESYTYKAYVSDSNAVPTIRPARANATFVGWAETANATEPTILSTKSNTDNVIVNDLRANSTTLYPVFKTGSIPADSTHYIYTDGSYQITNATVETTATEFYIPDMYDDQTNGLAKVTKIADGVLEDSVVVSGLLQGNTTVKTLWVGRNIKTIGAYSFYGCSSLTTVHFNDVLNNIRLYSFSHCTSLSSVKIPDSVTIIGSYAFEYCESLENVYVPNDVKTFYVGIFRNCTGLQEVHLPKNLKTIPNVTFYGCTALSNVNIPENITEVGDYAFQNCSALSKIVLPETVTTIKLYAFYNCRNLQVNLPDSVETIGKLAFYRCDKFTHLVLPASLTSIGDSAFVWCSNMNYVGIPKTVTSIGKSAFSSCPSLQQVAFEDVNGWATASTADATDWTSVDVSNKTINATNLTGDLSGMYWKKL